MTMLSPQQIRTVMETLARANPEPKTELVSVNAYTLLVAVMLSAQMTDKGVNKATAALFAVADSPEKMLALGLERLGEYVKSVNYWPTKARHIIETSQALVDRFGGAVPDTREALRITSYNVCYTKLLRIIWRGNAWPRAWASRFRRKATSG